MPMKNKFKQVPESHFYMECDVDEITGIKRGCRGQSKYSLQSDFLRQSGIPFFQNAIGRPIVAISAIEGRQGTGYCEQDNLPETAWKPRLVGV